MRRAHTQHRGLGRQVGLAAASPFARVSRAFRSFVIPDQIAAARDQQDEKDEAGRPPIQVCCVQSRDQRLDHERISRAARESCRRCSRHKENKDPSPPDDRCARTRPATAGRSRKARRTAHRSRPRTCRAARSLRRQPAVWSSPLAMTERQDRSSATTINAEMDHDRLAALHVLRQQMRIGVAGEQRRLEEDHGHRPDRRACRRAAAAPFWRTSAAPRTAVRRSGRWTR